MGAGIEGESSEYRTPAIRLRPYGLPHSDRFHGIYHASVSIGLTPNIMSDSIGPSTRACAQLLDAITTCLHSEACRSHSALEHIATEDQSARFRIWAGNIGTFAEDQSTASLGCRLRDEPKLTLQVHELLRDLEDTLRAGRW